MSTIRYSYEVQTRPIISRYIRAATVRGLTVGSISIPLSTGVEVTNYGAVGLCLFSYYIPVRLFACPILASILPAFGTESTCNTDSNRLTFGHPRKE